MDGEFSAKDRIRLRLVFDSPPPKFPQSSKYLILIDRNKCKTIQDVEQTIIEKLRFSKRAKFHLSLGEFSLVSSESTEILSNEDCLNIRYLGKEKINLKRKLSEHEAHISDVNTDAPSKCRRRSPHEEKQMKTKTKMNGETPSRDKERRKKGNSSKINASSKFTENSVVYNGNGLCTVEKNVSKESKSSLQQRGKVKKTDSKTYLLKKSKNNDSMLQDSSSSSSSSSESSESSEEDKAKNSSKINVSSSNTMKNNVLRDNNDLCPVRKNASKGSESSLCQKEVNETDSKTNLPKKSKNNDSALQDSCSSSSSSSESSESSVDGAKKKVQTNSKPLAVEKKSNARIVNPGTKSTATDSIVKLINNIQPKQNLPKVSKNNVTQKSKVQHIKFDSDSEVENAGDGCPDIVENAIHSKENAFKSSVPQQTAQLQDWLNSSVTKLAKRHAKNKMGKSQSSTKFKSSDTNKSVVIKNPIEEAVNNSKVDDTELRPHANYHNLDAAAWPPNVNATIAYKLLEMTENYTPEITDYKEAIVQEVFPSNVSPNGVHSIKVKVIWPCNTRRRSGRFEMEMSDEDEQHDAESIIEWQSLISPKIIPS